MPLTQDSLDLVHDLSHLLRGFGREITGPDGPHELGAHDLPLGGGEGYEHHIILIVPPCVIPFSFEGAHNLKRHVLDPNHGAHGIFSWLEQVLEDGIPQKHHFGGRVHLGLGKELSIQGSPSTDDQVVWRHGVDRREPVFVLVDDLHRISATPTGVGHTGDLLQLFHVRDGQRHCPAMSGPYPAESHRTRQDGDDIGAEGSDLGLDSGFRALSDTDHRDHGPHPDDDPQHRQRRAHAIAREDTERHDHRHQQKVHARTSCGTTRATATPPALRSERITPSFIVMARRA